MCGREAWVGVRRFPRLMTLAGTGAAITQEERRALGPRPTGGGALHWEPRSGRVIRTFVLRAKGWHVPGVWGASRSSGVGHWSSRPPYGACTPWPLLPPPCLPAPHRSPGRTTCPSPGASASTGATAPPRPHLQLLSTEAPTPAPPLGLSLPHLPPRGSDVAQPLWARETLCLKWMLAASVLCSGPRSHAVSAFRLWQHGLVPRGRRGRGLPPRGLCSATPGARGPGAVGEAVSHTDL